MDSDFVSVKDTLVPLDGSAAGYDALEVACLISRRNKGVVYAVYVIEVPRSEAIEAPMPREEVDKGEAILRRAEDMAAELDCRITGELLQARDWGHVIVDEAIDRDLDAIVMGITMDPELGEYRLGHTAQHVLRAAPCRVILCRSAEEEE